MASKNLKRLNGDSKFNRDNEWSTKLSVGVLSPWYDSLATTYDYIPPLAKSKRERKQQRIILEGLRIKNGTQELRAKWRLSQSKHYDRTWARCDEAHKLDELQKHDVDVIPFVAAIPKHVTLEEKLSIIENADSFLFETESCSNPEHANPGWGVKCVATWMLCGYWDKHNRTMLCKLLDFQKLREWAWTSINEVGGVARVERKLGWKRWTNREFNKTIGYIIPYKDMPPGVVLKEFTLKAPKDFVPPDDYNDGIKIRDRRK